MKYAEVSVNSPAAQRRTFSYSIPTGLNVSAGQAVWVPFGEKTLQGIVLELSPYPAVEETRDILDVIEPAPRFSTVEAGKEQRESIPAGGDGMSAVMPIPVAGPLLSPRLVTYENVQRLGLARSVIEIHLQGIISGPVPWKPPVGEYDDVCARNEL